MESHLLLILSPLLEEWVCFHMSTAPRLTSISHRVLHLEILNGVAKRELSSLSRLTEERLGLSWEMLLLLRVASLAKKLEVVGTLERGPEELE